LNKALSQQIGESGNHWWLEETEMKKLNVDNADDVLNNSWPKRDTNKENENVLDEETQILLIGFCNLYQLTVHNHQFRKVFFC